MGNAIIDRQLHMFGIDHDQTHMIRRVFEEHTEDHGIDADRLTGAGGTGHQQVGHLGQIGHLRLTRDILAQRQCQ